MATILLSAAGAALGGAVGGGALGLSSVVIGRAIGATIGRAIDQKLMGAGSEMVETGKLDRMRIMGASEGGALPRVFGRVRVPGNVIWTSNYRERVTEQQTGGGKGAPSGPTVRNYSYSISMAVALCEGEIARVGRVWVDGQIVSRSSLNMSVYTGSETQAPDPLMVSIEGEDVVPAYRGTAYVVFENLDLERWGNRVPQFSFEIVRHAQPEALEAPSSLADLVNGVAMLPGSGEYALASTPAYRATGQGGQVVANQNTEDGQTDILASLDQLTQELPNCRSVSLVVSWFGDDLRAGQCQCAPKVETQESGGSLAGLGSTPVYQFGSEETPTVWSPPAQSSDRTPWRVNGLSRSQAGLVGQVDGRPIYGGTPSDGSVLEAIAALKAQGQDVMFYPFLLMDILEGNALFDPWSGEIGQPALPWRGRITTERSPALPGSTDQTAAARAEVDAFMGVATPSDFTISGTQVTYTGPAELSYRRFILHYAYLCAAAGGVDAFCIGSEMRALTQIRDETGAFPAVEALVQLASEVKAILPGAQVGYAADWSEYFGYHPQDGSGDLLFHLDPLWASDDIDFIGIDNYLPISDWRDEDGHADQAAGTIYAQDYLQANIAGGEYFDWYYANAEDRALQIRTPITDEGYGEPWVWRAKDLRSWWSNAHYERVAGVRASTSTAWEPASKPIWFTELGCGAVDKGTNQPNKFFDEKSSESALPYASTGQRDDYIQMQLLQAYDAFFADEVNNPISPIYGAPMLDVSKTHVWAWDARPWPDFPNNLEVWTDGENYLTGHWITGRSANQTLASVIAELCEAAGVTGYDVSEVHGLVRGFSVTDTESPRASLQVLLVTYGVDAIEADGMLTFRNRSLAPSHLLEASDYVLADDQVLESSRAADAEVVGQVRVGFTIGDGAFENTVVSARFPGDGKAQVTQNDLPLSLTSAEAQAVAERWLSEARVARETVQLAVPPSRREITAGDLVHLPDLGAEYRVDRVEDAGARSLQATRVERQIYTPSDGTERLPSYRAFTVPIPITTQFLDLPLLTAAETPHAPYVAVSARPWPGSAAVYDAPIDADYALNQVIEAPAVLGVTETALTQAQSGRWAGSQSVRVLLQNGALSSVSREEVLGGRNAAAIGDGSGTNWEIIQFANAELVGPELYELSDLLRGQAGTDGVMPQSWPVGSRFVLLGGGVTQLSLDLAQRDLARHYRVGPGLRGIDDPSYRHYVEAFPGIGLRPYSPAHLRVDPTADGWAVTWIRRTRIDGDSWTSVDVPLGEDTELYQLRVLKDEVVLRDLTLSASEFDYPYALAIADGAIAPFEIQVAQISQSFGPGPFARKMINA